MNYCTPKYGLPKYETLYYAGTLEGTFTGPRLVGSGWFLGRTDSIFFEEKNPKLGFWDFQIWNQMLFIVKQINIWTSIIRLYTGYQQSNK